MLTKGVQAEGGSQHWEDNPFARAWGEAGADYEETK